jgi:hypothetical protein
MEEGEGDDKAKYIAPFINKKIIWRHYGLPSLSISAHNTAECLKKTSCLWQEKKVCL